MYERYYGFREAPFKLTANPKFLLMTDQYQEALTRSLRAVTAKPITVVNGEAGTGKSTLLRAALASNECRQVRCVFIDNPTLTRTEFVETLAARFDLGMGASTSKANLLHRLESVVRGRHVRRGIYGPRG